MHVNVRQCQCHGALSGSCSTAVHSGSALLASIWLGSKESMHSGLLGLLGQGNRSLAALLHPPPLQRVHEHDDLA